MKQYWIVGKTWNDVDKADSFYKLGKWECGYAYGDQPIYDKRIAKIQPGDAIAVKRMNGKGKSTITIFALGIVKGVENGVVFVNWIVTDLNRVVPSRGCFGTIHGAFKNTFDWTRKVFCL